MEFRRFLALLLYRKWIIILVSVVTVAVVAAGMQMSSPAYAASTLLRVPTIAGGSEDWVQYNPDYSDRLLRTYARIATSQPLLLELAETLALEAPLDVTVEVQEGTELMQITVHGSDPVLARDAANELARILIARGEQDFALDTRAPSPGFSMVEEATTPTTPSGPGLLMSVALALVVGLGGGVGMAVLFEALDSTLYTTEMIEEAVDLPVLTVVPQTRGWRNTIFKRGTAQAEAFRRLSVHLSRNETRAQTQSLLITGMGARQGTSTVAANLAVALARQGYRTAVLDANTRAPSLHRVFRTASDVGLSDILVGESTLSKALQPSSVVPNLEILTIGTHVETAMDAIGTGVMVNLMGILMQDHDFVLVDMPPYLSVADTAVLADRVSAGILLVIGRARSRREAVEAVNRQLKHCGTACLGVVVTQGERLGTPSQPAGGTAMGWGRKPSQTTERRGQVAYRRGGTFTERERRRRAQPPMEL